MTQATTTYLAAINSMLSAAGEMPVGGYTATYGADAVLANQILLETSNSIQAVGWFFNTRKGPITLTPNGSSQIVIPDPVIRIEFYNYDDSSAYAIRNGFLFNLKTNVNNDFTTTVIVKTITELLDWTDLPESARQYIMKKAARIFVDRHVSDPQLARLARQDELEAMMLLNREDVASQNARIFGPDHAWIVDMAKPLDHYWGSIIP